MKESSAVAHQLLCALDTYEAAFSAWTATPSLLDVSRVEHQLQKVRVLRMLVPQVASEMAEVLTSHVDLSMMYVRDRTGAFGKQHSDEELALARRKHSQAIEAMRLHCCRLAGDGPASGDVEPVSRTIRSPESMALADIVHQLR